MQGKKRGRRRAAAPMAMATAAVIALLATATPAAAAKPGPAAAFGATSSNTCAARTLISPGPQTNGLFGYATAIENQSVVVSAPGEFNPSTGQRRAYLGLRAAPRPPSACVYSSYFALAPVPSPPEDEFVQLSVFGATGFATSGQRTFFLGSQVDSAYYCDYFQTCGGSGAKTSSSASSAKVSSSTSSPDPLLAQALAKAAAPTSAALAAKAGVTASSSSSSSTSSNLPRLVGRASPQLSGKPVSVLSALAAARAESSSGETVGERLSAFMAGSGASDRARRGAATAPLLEAAAGAAARGGALLSKAGTSLLAERNGALFAPLVANVSLSGQRLVAAAAASSSSSPSPVFDGDGNGQRSAPPKLSLTGASAPVVPALSADRPRLSGGAPSPLAAAAAAAQASTLLPARSSTNSSSNTSTTAAAAAPSSTVGLTPVVYGEVAVFYRLIAQGSPAQGSISNVKRTQVQGPFSLPVTFDLVSDSDVAAFFQELYPNADPSTFFFFLGSTNPWIAGSADGSAAVFNDLRMYGASGYDSLLYDGSLQVFSRQGTTNAYKMVDLIYNPYPDVPMVFPLFSALSADGLTLVATGWAYDEGQYGTDVVFVFTRSSTGARFGFKQQLLFDSLTEAVTSVGISPDGLALAVATTTFQPLDGSGALDFDQVLANVAVARTYGRASSALDFAPRCRFDNLLPAPSEWDVELANTDNAGRVQAVKLAPILGKKPRRGPTPTIGYRLLASVLGAPAEVYDYDARLGAACPSIPVQRIGAPLGVPGAIDAFGDLAGSAMSADGRTAGIGSQYATEASFPQLSGASYYYGLVPLSGRF